MKNRKIKLRTKHIFRAKHRFHCNRAKMSYGRKIQQLVELQKLANEIRVKRGDKPGFVWQI